MRWLRQKRTVVPEHLLDLHQVGNGVHGCVQVGGEWSGIDLIFIDARVKINDAYYHGACDLKATVCHA